MRLQQLRPFTVQVLQPFGLDSQLLAGSLVLDLQPFSQDSSRVARRPSPCVESTGEKASREFNGLYDWSEGSEMPCPSSVFGWGGSRVGALILERCRANCTNEHTFVGTMN